ncbi:IS30 family transposase [Paenibacillus terreus]|uniref:IS30 family transposase n=1 Tax=Paenibacillus terreus TaxID=1387834 RepID=A0ABV5BG01_9BACL
MKGVLTVLQQKGKRQQPAETRGKFAIGKPISLCPKEVQSLKRSVIGNWILSFPVAGKAKAVWPRSSNVKRACTPPFGWLTAIALSMEIAFGVAVSQYPSAAFQTATTDRGKKFACYASQEDTHGTQVYFADLYSSWQRGSNENANRLLREFFPKGTDFAQITDEALEDDLHLINHRPRKCLGWKTDHESFSEDLSHFLIIRQVKKVRFLCFIILLSPPECK